MKYNPKILYCEENNKIIKFVPYSLAKILNAKVIYIFYNPKVKVQKVLIYIQIFYKERYDGVY